ncbi:MAG: flagellar assembly protein FliX [Alphaproteobacteria bacterium]|jgi:replicative DNA helicase
MKITRTGSPSLASVRRSSQSKGSSSKSFGDHMNAKEASVSSGVSGAAGVSAVDSLLAIQEVDTATDRPAKAKQRAEDILDRLDELRHGLLVGAFSRRQLEKLAELVRNKRQMVDDPALSEILDQVELRAEIELAKYATLD